MNKLSDRSGVRHWWVVSPEMCEVIPITDDGQGPVECGHDVVSLAAPTKREAIRLGVPLLKEWSREARQDGLNPYQGVKAEDARCSHGVCFCEVPGCDGGPDARSDGHGGYDCAACAEEFYAQHPEELEWVKSNVE